MVLRSEARILVYSDDIVLTSETAEDVSRLLSFIRRLIAIFRIRLNPRKVRVTRSFTFLGRDIGEN